MRTWPLFLLVLLASCSLQKGYNKKVFGYAEGNRLQKLVLQVPEGYVMEKTLLDTTGGKELYFYYDNGAILYYTRDVSWLTENAPVLPADASMQSQFSFRGVDKEGLHWKEIRIDGIRIGYSYVPPALVDQFDYSIRNMHARKPM